MKYVLTCLIIIVYLGSSRAQLAYWNKYNGGSGFDMGKELILKENGSIIVAGETYSTDGLGEGNNNPYHSDIVLYNYTTQGFFIWKTKIGGSKTEEIGEFIETSDGGYALIGTTSSADGDIPKNHGELDIWVVKLDDLGEIQWSRTFGGTGNDRGFAIEETERGGFLIGGESGSVNGTMQSPHHGGLDSWVAKLGASGDLMWEKHYGGIGNERVCRIHEFSWDEYVIIHSSNSDDGDRNAALGKKRCLAYRYEWFWRDYMASNFWGK